MEKSEIYKIFVEGIKFGLKYGHFPKDASLSALHQSLTKDVDDDTRSTLWIVLMAGDNYGANAKGVMPSEEEMEAMFENLIEGKPLIENDNAYYAIKHRIDKILSGDGNSKP